MVKEIFLTFDIDWVADWILEETISILKAHQVKATFFATHESKLLNSLDPKQFEIGLHPNFEKLDGQIDFNTIRELKKLYPNAVGMRSHTLFFSSRLIPILTELDIKYESNIFLFQHEGLHTVTRAEELKSIPFNWSDDKHIELGYRFTTDNMPSFDNDGLNIFNFHPIHVFLNTKNQIQYNKSRSDFNSSELFKHKNGDDDGTKNMLISLCKSVEELGLESKILKSLIIS